MIHILTDLSSKPVLAKLYDREPCEYDWLYDDSKPGRRVHIAGLGDVGRMVSIGLRLCGAPVISRIGLYDLSGDQCRRMEMELSQILFPGGRRDMPSVDVIRQEEIFDCDIFLFCAAGAVPAVGSQVKDVRMAQYETNRKILSFYVEQAVREHFQGLFGIVSDPVDLLCMQALSMSGWGRGLHPEQIQGFGLGVMYARAAYYAKEDPGCGAFLTAGRVFGPHGQGLVAANSTDPSEYLDEASRRLTESVIHANQKMRELGYKPFIAPALSSAALSVIDAAAGRFNDSARFLNGIYFGARNRVTREGTLWEQSEGSVLPPALCERIEKAYRDLEAYYDG